jgi:LacI family transcriptional regulator
MAGIKDVAARAGVSVASVSRVLNESKPVSAETRDRVLAAVRDLNYSIDQRARALRRRKSGTLGLVVAEVRNPFFSEVIHSIEAVAYESNYSLFLCNSNEDAERERFHLRAMQAQRIDGIIILPVTTSGRALLPLIKEQVPVVCLDRRVDDMDLDSVLVDNVAGARLAVSHLVALGHRRIGYIGGRPLTPEFERLAGYRQGLAAHTIPEDPDLVRRGDSLQPSGYTQARALLDLPTPPSAIFVINNPMALGALTAIRERGLRVPRDISVIAFDDAPWSALLDPPLTTIAQPTDMLGTAAARLLLAHIEGQYAGPAQHLVLPPRLIERASTDRAPAAGAARDIRAMAPAEVPARPPRKRRTARSVTAAP